MKYRNRLKKLLSSGQVPDDHPFRNVDTEHPMSRPLEFFLSLEDVPGFSGSLKSFITRPQPVATTNEQSKQWAAVCAELGATSIIGQALGLKIEEFEARSPRAQGNRTCDVRASRTESGRPLFFEVKRNQREDKQELPPALESMLNDLPIPFSCTAGLLKHDYDCEDLADLRAKIIGHVKEFLRWQENGHLVGEGAPAGYWDHRVEVIFHEKERVSSGGQYFTPLSRKDLCAHLLESGRSGRDGKPMKPMVVQAMEKGADYLVYRASAWGSLDDVVEECFEGIQELPGGVWSSSDPRLGSLQGVILFERYDRFVLVETDSGRMSLASAVAGGCP